MATSASGIYSETLQSIVDAKLVELERKRSEFEASRVQLLATADRQSTDTAKLQVLVNGIKSMFGIRSSDGRIVHGSSKNVELEEKLANLERFLTQPQYDTSVSTDMLNDWKRELYQQLDVQTSRFEYASLYAQLVTEWLTTEKKIAVKQEDSVELDASGFEQIDSKRMMESRSLWASNVFQPHVTDASAILQYLQTLFGEIVETKQTPRALKQLRTDVADFQDRLSQPDQFDENVLKWVIKDLLATDLLTEDKRNVLRDFLPNSIILNELADVLNLRMSSIDTWSWGDGVSLEQKRNIQGQFHIVMHEDLLQAIFLQYIGAKWSVFLKNALSAFIEHPGSWALARKDPPVEHFKRREYFLGPLPPLDSLSATRDALWRSTYFMNQLPNYEGEKNTSDEGEVEADYAAPQMYGAPAPSQAPQMARKMMAKPAPPPGMVQQNSRKAGQPIQAARNLAFGGGRMRDSHVGMDVATDPLDRIKTPQNPIQAKQTLLHLLSSEILINTHLKGNLTAFRAQYESWNPLLPHSTILSVLEYLGVSKRWLRFFTTFLQAPLKFNDEDVVRHRQRGVPAAHALSDVFGEVVLFCLDYSVNQATKGARLWRVHDDFWFWSVDHNTSVVAWRTVQSFSKVMGLTLALDKSGSARTGLQAGQLGADLPRGSIRWGFLHLDSVTGRFEIDQQMVDHHVQDLRRQLDAKTSSIFSWVEAWNAYANTFFTTNFGKPANCFGRQHIDAVLSTLQRTQKDLFQADNGASSVVQYLKSELSNRFGITDVPEGWAFFPAALGGLELRNPFILLLHLRDVVSESPQKLLTQLEDDEQEQYRRAKTSFESGNVARHSRRHADFVPEDGDTFMSFEEYVMYREEFRTGVIHSLREVFVDLMRQPDHDSISPSTEIRTALDHMDRGGVVGRPGKCGINGDWDDMEPYWRWILALHGPPILRRFGGLNIVDNGVLPIGMVSLFRSKGVSWTG